MAQLNSKLYKTKMSKTMRKSTENVPVQCLDDIFLVNLVREIIFLFLNLFILLAAAKQLNKSRC